MLIKFNSIGTQDPSIGRLMIPPTIGYEEKCVFVIENWLEMIPESLFKVKNNIRMAAVVDVKVSGFFV